MANGEVDDALAGSLHSEETLQITVFEPPSRLIIYGQLGPFQATTSYLLTPAAGGTRLTNDIETDVLAAQRQGLTGVLVKTGKYLPSAHRHASGTPDHVLGSFADLPALLENLS